MNVETFSLRIVEGDPNDGPKYPGYLKYEADDQSRERFRNLWLHKKFFVNDQLPGAVQAKVTWPVPQGEESDDAEGQVILVLKKPHLRGTLQYWSEGEPRLVNGLYLDPRAFPDKPPRESVLLNVTWRE